MIQRQLKLRLSRTQEKTLDQWLWHLTGVWNWAVRKMEQDSRDGVRYSKISFCNLLANHSERMDISGHSIQGILALAFEAWMRRFKKISNKPHLKGFRKPLRHIPFPDPVKTPLGNRVTLPLLGKLRFHKQDIPKGKIKRASLIKRASGWYVCLVIDAQRAPIRRVEDRGAVGIDPGFKDLLTLSDGTKIPHPRELEAGAKRLAQAQRGHNKKLASRLQERTANQKKDRNHKLSLWLVQNYSSIYFSKDNTKGMAKRFGKSVKSSNHYQLREMLRYKCPVGGASYSEIEPSFSTKTCSSCGALTGPTGLAGLKVRYWDCSACGSHHDRDINAAINTLNIGSGLDLERTV